MTEKTNNFKGDEPLPHNFMAEFGPRLVDQGYHIVPLMPAAKKPGEWVGDHWRPMSGWNRFSDRQPTTLEMSHWSERWPGTGGGIICGSRVDSVAALDLDITNEEVANAIQELAFRDLGDTPAIRIGLAPKRLLVYGSVEPIKPIKKHPLEVLGQGNQFVAYGIHPATQRPYAWPFETLVDIHVEDLPQVTEAEMRAFLEKAYAIIPPELRQKSLGPDLSEGTFKGSNGDLKGTPEAIQDALSFIRNDDLDYSSWMRIGYAVKGALGDAGRDLFMAWSAKSRKDDPQVTQKLWRDAKPEQIGAGTIYKYAMIEGWRCPPGIHLNPIAKEAAERGAGAELLKNLRKKGEKMRADRGESGREDSRQEQPAGDQDDQEEPAGDQDDQEEPAGDQDDRQADLAALLATMPEAFRSMVAIDPKLYGAWFHGEGIGKTRDRSPSALEAALAYYLAKRLADPDLETVLRAYPYGAVGGGHLKGLNADRRIQKLLDKAAEIRARAPANTNLPPWWHELKTTTKGEVRDCLANAAIILRQDRLFAGKIQFDELLGAAVARDMEWHGDGAGWVAWTDADDLRVADWMQAQEVPIKPSTVAAAVQLVAVENSFHPILQFLDGLKWDGTKRIASWLIDHLGVADTGFARAVGRKFLIAAVARVRRPGCKMDNALIFEGEQDQGKSSAARVLAVFDEWFADEVADLGTKDSGQDLRGKWVIELAELSAMRRGEVERVKAFMSRSIDHYRPSYGKRSQDFPRQCVFIGSTNQDAYLHDETGNRRFWPVRVGKINLTALRRDVEQLWAEADAAYRAGESWWLADHEKPDARQEQEARRVRDPWEAVIEGWLSGSDPDFIERRFKPVEVERLLRDAIGMPIDRQDLNAQKRVGAILRGMGWARKQRRRPVEQGSGRFWCFVSPDVTDDDGVDSSTGDRTGDTGGRANAG